MTATRTGGSGSGRQPRFYARRTTTYELVERDLRTIGVHGEPPGVAKDSGGTDVASDDHVPEEEPSANEGFLGVSRRVRMIWWSGGLKPRAVAGRPSVMRLTQSSCTGMRASGMPSSTVKKIETTSPMLDEIKYRMNCFVLL